MSSYRIDDQMVRHPIVIPPDAFVEDALLIMNENDLRHLPVVLDDELIGIVSERDLKSAERAYGALLVSDIMTRNLFVVRRNTPVADVAREMAAGKFGSALIVNDEGRIDGIFTTTDALRMLSDLLDDQPFDSLLSDEDYEDGLEKLIA